MDAPSDRGPTRHPQTQDPSFRRVLEIGIGEAPNVPYYPRGSQVTGEEQAAGLRLKRVD